MRYLIASITCFTLALGVSYSAWGSPIEDFRTGYEAGTFLPDDENRADYVALYSITSDRHLDLYAINELEDHTRAGYTLRMIKDGGPFEQHGALYLYHDPVRVEYHATDAPILSAGMDVALSGAIADVGSTAYGLSTGLVVEANPMAFAALPIGLAVGPISNGLGLHDCIALRKVSGLRWGAAAWNMALLASGSYAVGLVVGAATGWWSWGMSDLDAPARCVSGTPTWRADYTDHNNNIIN